VLKVPLNPNSINQPTLLELIFMITV